MIRNPIDVASRVSPRLSALLSSRVNNPECEQPVTLMAVRRFLADLLPDDFKEAEQLHHFDVDISILDELDALIEEFGGSSLAVDFVQASASTASPPHTSGARYIRMPPSTTRNRASARLERRYLTMPAVPSHRSRPHDGYS